MGKFVATHGMWHTRVYHVWVAMRQRCFSKTCAAYVNYGGRGITVCTEWLEFSQFFEDMGHPPAGMTLERRDNDQDYSRSNCYWADRYTQARNQRVRVDSITGVPGVRWCNDRKAYRVYIRRYNKRYALGYTPDFFEACCRRKAKENEFIVSGLPR